MIARILVKPAATKTQILMLFALVFTMASVAVALPVPQAAYRWIGALLGVVVILFFGGYVVRHTMIIYEYLLYADRLIVRRHFRKWIRTTATISHKSIQKILPITDPELQHLHRHDATVSFGGILDNRFAIVYQGQKKREALLLECGYPFAKSISKTVAEYQAAHKGV
ncbi:MAG: hypothetical protein IKM13_09335 [Clostridia bacterium]|nr:hypothetical protein [Clostridia bacterium]